MFISSRAHSHQRWLILFSLDVDAVSRSDHRIKWRDAPRWLVALLAVSVLNTFSFIAIAAAHGGHAFNGYIRGYHYFVCHRGACTEVSRSFWLYSYWHTIFTFMAAFGVIMTCFIYFMREIDV
jgi:uncharacterized membrane protein